MPTVTINPDRQTPRDIDNALRKLKKKVESAGTLKKLHEREGYEKPTAKRKRKRGAAIARHRREIANQTLPPKLY